MTTRDELAERQRRERAELNYRQGEERRELGETPPPRDGTPEAARAAFEARSKLAHSRLYLSDFVTVLESLGLHLPGHSFEATANALIMGLPVHAGCIVGAQWNPAGERERRLAGPVYPLITANVLGASAAQIRHIVASQLRSGDIVDPEIEAFEAEAAGDDHKTVLAAARRWVTVHA